MISIDCLISEVALVLYEEKTYFVYTRNFKLYNNIPKEISNFSSFSEIIKFILNDKNDKNL